MYADREEEVIHQRRVSVDKGRPVRANGYAAGTRSSRRRAAVSPLSVSPSVSPSSASISRSRSISRSLSRSRSPHPPTASRARGTHSPVSIRGAASSSSAAVRRRRASPPSSEDDESDGDGGAGREKRRRRDGATSEETHEELRRRALLTRNSRARYSHDSPPAHDEVHVSSPPPPRSTASRDSERRRMERRERRRGRGRDLLEDAEDMDVESRTRSRSGNARRVYGDDEEDEDSYERRRRRGSGRAARVEEQEAVSDRRSRHASGPRSHAGGSQDDSADDRDDARSTSRRGSSVRRDDYDDPYYRRGPPRAYDPSYDRYYAPPPRAYYDRYGPPPPGRYGPRDPYGYYSGPPRRHTRSPSPPPRRRRGESRAKSPEDPADYENRSIFCSQLAARLTQRDLGEFFEDKLGERTVEDVRIVMDKITGRSKGIGYVELKDESLVDKALELSNTVVFGIPILIQRTDAARNRGAGASTSDTPARPNLPAPPAEALPKAPQINGEPIHLDPKSATSAASRLYVGNLHFSLTDEHVRGVFEPFGPIISVDLHREPATQKSKGFAFVQYASVDIAEKAIQHMNGFELAGRQIRVNHVNAAKMDNPPSNNNNAAGANSNGNTFNAAGSDASGAQATITTSFDEGGGGGLNASSRAALMEKLARIDKTDSPTSAATEEQQRPATIPEASSCGVLLKNMFNPEEETERGWDTELAEDVKDECEAKYGKVEAIKVDANSLGEVWIRFTDLEGARKAIAGLNGRFFGGRSIGAAFVSEGILKTMLK